MIFNLYEQDNNNIIWNEKRTRSQKKIEVFSINK